MLLNYKIWTNSLVDLSENDPYEIMMFPIHCSLSRPLYIDD